MAQQKQTLQGKLDSLDRIVKSFESSGEQTDIDRALKDYEEAMKLVSEIRTQLSGVELKIKEIQDKYSEDQD
ncbi:MAG: Exodeoxyribonuclease 7 small subunit [candidate division WS6 bacterium OLB20]|uniref:Exodeoxyribonuclease VII small subunit n=1 Tax=candidate division WS6 bacterium OLB20 TaxID=1617426 RepID=A0A136LXL0_9BACT|nr:MAG: Exodeoxyribonuclease 7 small subunit [candidate division WS6 bacterium OLB20]